MKQQKHYIVRDHERLQNCIAFLAGLPLNGNGWRVTIEPYRKNRTLAQNNLYWLWLTIIVEHIAFTTGQHFSPEDAHEWFRDEFLPPRVIEIRGKVKTARPSTARLNTVEFSEYLGKIDYWCNDRLDLILPHPDDLYREAMGVAA